MDKYQLHLAGEKLFEGVGDHDVTNLKVQKYSLVNVQLVIAELIICDEISFKVVKGKGFIKVYRPLNHSFKSFLVSL